MVPDINTLPVQGVLFDVSVAFTGFAAPKMYINLKKSYSITAVGGQTLPTIRFEPPRPPPPPPQPEV